MKLHEFYLDEQQVSTFFAPIRSKGQTIALLMNSIKAILTNNSLPQECVKGKMVLLVDKMSRLFYISEDKIFSINFPFYMSNEDSDVFIKYKSGDIVDNKFTSNVLAVLESSHAFISYDVLDFIDPIAEADEDVDNFWFLLREMLLFEDGYIRYDYDTEHINGNIHPVNHIDVFYTSNVSFKLGLHNRIDHDHLIDLLDPKTDCHFLSKLSR